ncbi:MAG TPA: hypothetical protein VF095_09010 [Bacillota bacterium]
MSRKKEREYTDFSNVVNMQNALIPEEFPEGAFGDPFNQDDPVQAKSTPWQRGQYRESAFVYPDKERHDDLPRQTPGAHPIHDEDEEQ